MTQGQWQAGTKIPYLWLFIRGRLFWVMNFIFLKKIKKQKNDLTSLNPLVPRPATVAVLRHWTSIMIVLVDIGYLYQALKSIKNRKRLSIKNCQKTWKPEIINWKPEIIYSASTLILRPLILWSTLILRYFGGFEIAE